MLFISGCLLAPTTLDFRLQYDMPWRLSGDARIMTVSLHVFVSFLIVMALGAIWHLHMRIGLRKGKNVYSGLFLVGSLLVLTLTGVGVLYFGNERMSVFSSLSHLAAGLLLMALFIYHYIKGRMIARAAR